MEITRKEIQKAFFENGTDKFVHGYDQMYADVFSKMTGVSKLLEIGVRKGKSLGAWMDLFPAASITGVDIREYEGFADKARAANLILADSARTSIKDKVGTGYDIIIDDGDHRIDWQTQTFMNLRGCWTQAYVIEDVVGIEHEKMMRRRLMSMGYTRFMTYASARGNGSVPMQMSGEIKNVTFYGLVVYPRTFD